LGVEIYVHKTKHGYELAIENLKADKKLFDHNRRRKRL